MSPQELRRRHWRLNRWLTASLLGLWFVVTFGFSFFARDWDVRVLGWPLPFWLAAQGSLLVYLLIVVIYAGVMNRLDRACGVAEPEE